MKDENITRQLDKLKVFFLKYYPIRIKNVGLEEKVARQIVWDFKDGNHYEAVAQMTAKRLVEHFGEQVRNAPPIFWQSSVPLLRNGCRL